jgi:hypothetical protein
MAGSLMKDEFDRTWKEADVTYLSGIKVLDSGD